MTHERDLEGEELAAHLAGELAPEQRRALERRLATDPALRAQLDRVRAVDAVLADLPDPAPLADDVVARLHATVQDELDRTPLDELARRRARRPVMAWAGGAVAAVLALVVGIQVLPRAGDDAADGDATVAADMAEGPAETGQQEETAVAALPLVRASGRDYSADDVRTLAAEVASPLDAGAVADGLRDVFLRDAPATANQQTAPTDEAADDSAVADADSAGAAELAPDADEQAARSRVEDDAAWAFGERFGVDAEAAAHVLRCLPEVLDGDDAPVFVDVARYEGEPALVVVLAELRAGTPTGRRLAYVLSSADCFVRFYAPTS